MKHIELLCFVAFSAWITLAVPTYGQLPKKAPKINANTLNRSVAISRTARIYTIALGNTPAKQALNARLIYTEEVRRALQMYQQIDHLPLLEPAFKKLRQTIQDNIINHTIIFRISFDY